MKLRHLALLVFTLVCMAASPAAAREDLRLFDRMTKVLGQEVRYAQLSPDGAYVAVVLQKEVALTTPAGKMIWRRPLTGVNRYLTDLEISAAPGPGGRLVAIGGGPSFRKVLLLDARGRTLAHFSTRGTPQGFAFDHGGKRLAVGTAGGWLYVASLASVQGNKPHPFRAFPTAALRRLNLGGYFSGLAYSPDDRYLATTFAGGTVALLHGSGSLLWRRDTDYYADLRPCQDWQWFTVCEVPTHGPLYGTISLVSRAGKRLWTVSYRDPQAAVSPDHRFVLMRAGPDTPRVYSDAEPPVEWRVADWKGRELPRNGKGESARFVAPDGTILTVRDMNWTATRNGRTLWKLRTEFYRPAHELDSQEGETNETEAP